MHQTAAHPGIHTTSEQTPREPNLSEKCRQFEDRIASIRQALIELEGVSHRLLGVDVKAQVGGTLIGNTPPVPQPVQPVDLHFAENLMQLANAEGWLRTILSRLDRGV
jgi:hypothetical protein